VEKLLRGWLRVLKPSGILGLTSEVLLKSPWEEAFHALEQNGSITHLESRASLNFLPLNGDKWTAEQTVHMYFYQKPAETTGGWSIF